MTLPPTLAASPSLTLVPTRKADLHPPSTTISLTPVSATQPKPALSPPMLRSPTFISPLARRAPMAVVRSIPPPLACPRISSSFPDTDFLSLSLASISQLTQTRSIGLQGHRDIRRGSGETPDAHLVPRHGASRSLPCVAAACLVFVSSSSLPADSFFFSVARCQPSPKPHLRRHNRRRRVSAPSFHRTHRVRRQAHSCSVWPRAEWSLTTLQLDQRMDVLPV